MDHLFPRTSIYFSNQLILIRESLKLSQERFALMCQLSRTTIKRLEQKDNKEFAKKNSWNKINNALNKEKYFERKDIPSFVIKSHITYACDDVKIHVIPYDDSANSEKPKKREMIKPIYHPTIKTIWQPVNSYQLQ
jgi:transcriptional regulator with XRE-family HTH domain